MRLSPIFGCIALALALAPLGVGCGGSSPAAEPLTCAWLSGPDNCWKNTALMATSCLPAEADTGTLSADNASCVYTAGAMVAFTPALVLPVSDDPTWNFTITGADSAPCLHFESVGGAGYKLVVGGNQTVTAVVTASLAEVITCPDGKSFQGANALDLLACASFLPGISWASFAAPPSISADLAGTGDTLLPLYDCSGP